MVTDFFTTVAGNVVDFITGPLVGLIPSIIGYTALFTGGMMMLAPLVNRSVLGPFGVLAAVSIVGISVMEVL